MCGSFGAIQVEEPHGRLFLLRDNPLPNSGTERFPCRDAEWGSSVEILVDTLAPKCLFFRLSIFWGVVCF